MTILTLVLILATPLPPEANKPVGREYEGKLCVYCPDSIVYYLDVGKGDAPFLKLKVPRNLEATLCDPHKDGWSLRVRGSLNRGVLTVESVLSIKCPKSVPYKVKSR